MKSSHRPAARRGLVLDKIVLLGRTLDEYRRFFALDLEGLQGQAILDVASGVSSFCAEAHRLELDVTACDPIYDWPLAKIERHCTEDLGAVIQAFHGLDTYRWDFYQSPENMGRFRERASRAFLSDYALHQGSRYRSGRLPDLPFPDAPFDLTLVSYLLFVYEAQFDYEFHKRSLLEIMRVTRGEARFYPTVTFAAEPSRHLGRLQNDPDLRELGFEEVPTDFEFLINSNRYLRVFHR